MLSNCPLSDIVSMPGMSSGRHSLEEGDQLVLLNACDVMHKDPQSFLDVFSVDTDKRADALIGWYAFKGTDNTGSFAEKGVSCQFKAFLQANDDILDAFSRFGTLGDTCAEKVPELRWMLLAQKSKEGQGQLPPTLGSLVPHTARAYHMALIWKTSKEPYIILLSFSCHAVHVMLFIFIFMSCFSSFIRIMFQTFGVAPSMRTTDKVHKATLLRSQPNILIEPFECETYYPNKINHRPSLHADHRDIQSLYTNMGLETNSTSTVSVNDSVALNSSTECPYHKCMEYDDYVDFIQDYIFPKWYEWVFIVLHLLVFLVGVVGNTLVCVSVYRNRSLRTFTNCFIVNLAVADFLVIVICLPPTVIWDVTETWFFGILLCKLIIYFQFGLARGSVDSNVTKCSKRSSPSLFHYFYSGNADNEYVSGICGIH
ncbi:Orexin receptor type 1 [Nymphon striatum]|nr:Orexin receptor type 1 [Nymphon striatum]